MAEGLSELPALSEPICKKILPIKAVHKKLSFPEVPLKEKGNKKYFHAAMWFVFSAESTIFTENRINVLATSTLSLNNEGFRNSFGTDSL